MTLKYQQLYSVVISFAFYLILYDFIFLTAAINLQFIGEQAEAMFGVGYVVNNLHLFHIIAEYCSLCQVDYEVDLWLCLYLLLVRKANSILEVDDEGGRMFLRVLIHLIMHDYPPLVSGALQLLFKHFSQRQEVLQTFKQVSHRHRHTTPPDKSVVIICLTVRYLLPRFQYID